MYVYQDNLVLLYIIHLVINILLHNQHIHNYHQLLYILNIYHWYLYLINFLSIFFHNMYINIYNSLVQYFHYNNYIIILNNLINHLNYMMHNFLLHELMVLNNYHFLIHNFLNILHNYYQVSINKIHFLESINIIYYL